MILDWRLGTREFEIQDEREVGQDIATISGGVAKTFEGRAAGEPAAG